MKSELKQWWGDDGPEPGYIWQETVRELLEGRFPHVPTLARALRWELPPDDGEPWYELEHQNLPIPKLVRTFLANFMEGKVKRPRGSPPKYSPMGMEVETLYLQHLFRLEHARIKEIPRQDRKTAGTPFEVALHETVKAAAKEGIRVSEETLKKRLKIKDRPGPKP